MNSDVFFLAAPWLRQKGESKSIRSGDRCSTIVLGRSNGGRHEHSTGKDDGSVGDVSNLSAPKMKCVGGTTTNFVRPLCALIPQFGSQNSEPQKTMCLLCAGAEEPEAGGELIRRLG